MNIVKLNRFWRRAALIGVLAIALNHLLVSDALGQRGRGGGGRGGGGGMSRGGGGHSSMNRSPSMSRPSTPSMSRPSGGGANIAGNRGGGGVSNRPQAGAGVAARPQPGGGNAGRPQVGGQRPSTGIAQGNRPSGSELTNFLNLSGQGGSGAGRVGSGQGAPANRPGGGAALPAAGNAAVADFFNSGPKPQTAGAGSIAGNRADNIGDRSGARSDVRDQRGEQRDFASENRQDRVSDRGDRQAARVSDRGEMRSNLADGRSDRRSDRQRELGDQADHIRDEMRNEFDDNHLFEDFWYDHPHAYYHFQQNPVFWTWATFATASAFMPWNWGTPAYYDYGTGGNVYYEGENVVANGETIPAEEYATQAETIATSAPKVDDPDSLEWLPLGVFAITQDGNPNAVPNMFLQMAVSKEGIIAGTYQNKSTDQTESIEGMVDQKSQRAAWTIVGKNTPIMETGIANLTENETKALVHFADGTTQQWLMLHVEKPADSSQPKPAPSQ